MERALRFFTYAPSVLLIVLVFFISLHTLTSVNQDIGRHLALGKIIWETQHVPDTNLFSYTWPDFPFIDHHWLAEVLFFLGESVVGLEGLIILKAILMTLAFGLALFSVAQRDNLFPSLAVGLVGLGIVVERTDVRPEVLSFVFLGWFLFVLFGRRMRLLWTLPLVQVLWANSHIYFFMGPLIAGLFIIQEYFNTKQLPERRWLWTGVLVLVANFINPSFVQGALYPFVVLKDYGYSIVENQSPFFLKAFGYSQFTTNAVWTGVALAIASMAINFRNLRTRIAGNALMILTAVSALAMVRNFPLFGLSLIPGATQNLYDAGIRIKGRVVMGIFSVVLLALAYSIVTNQFSQRVTSLGRFGLVVPQGSQAGVDFVRAQGLRGPMFNNFDVGSFLIWKLPEEKVFIDGRPEAYPADFIRDVYIKMQEDPVVWKRESEWYGIRFVFWDNNDITPWSRTFVARMRKDSAWPLVYDDGRTLIFIRKGVR